MCLVFLAILVDDRTLVALISKSGNSPDKRAHNRPVERVVGSVANGDRIS